LQVVVVVDQVFTDKAAPVQVVLYTKETIQ
jgi:hypothetical protein